MQANLPKQAPAARALTKVFLNKWVLLVTTWLGLVYAVGLAATLLWFVMELLNTSALIKIFALFAMVPVSVCVIYALRNPYTTILQKAKRSASTAQVKGAWS